MGTQPGIESAGGSPGGEAARRLVLLAILALALGVRLAHWWMVRSDPFFDHLALDSQEYDRWARAIAAGDWQGSGVFFQAPLYPYAVAVLYAAFGARVDAVYLAQILLAVAGCWALYRAGRAFADELVGIFAAGLAATYPVFVFHDVQVLKTSPAVAVASFLLWALAAAWRRGPVSAWLAVGVFCGLLSSLRENFLVLVPCGLLLAFFGRPHSLQSRGLRSAAVLAGVALVLLPVAIRNQRVGGSFLPTTFQGGVNFYIGNNPEADGTYRPLVPGKQVPFYERHESVRLAEEAAGRELSPSEVSAYWLSRSLDWARAEPGAFLALQLRKLRMFWSWYEWPDAVDYYYVRELSPVLRFLPLEWSGLTLLAVAGLWWLRRDAVRFLPVLIFLGVAVVSTVAFFLFSRYRLPVAPALMLLAALPLRAGWIAVRGRRWRALVVPGALAAVALAIPRLASFEPRMDLVHFNLGRIAEERGQEHRATAHYQAALRYDPESLSPLLNLGNQAARQSRWREARSWYERALAAEPASDDARANLGGVLLEMGELTAARAELERALEANPRNRYALRNLAILYRRLGDREAAGRLEQQLKAVPDDPG